MEQREYAAIADTENQDNPKSQQKSWFAFRRLVVAPYLSLQAKMIVQLPSRKEINRHELDSPNRRKNRFDCAQDVGTTSPRNGNGRNKPHGNRNNPTDAKMLLILMIAVLRRALLDREDTCSLRSSLSKSISYVNGTIIKLLAGGNRKQTPYHIRVNDFASNDNHVRYIPRAL